MGITVHLTCLLRNLYAGPKAKVITGHGTMDWFKIERGLCQGCIVSPCLVSLYTEYIMQNVRLDESQAGIKIARRNISHLRYADDTAFMAETEEKLKSLLMRVKEKSERASLKLNIQKTNIMASWGKAERVTDFIFLGSKVTVQGDCSHEIKKTLAPWKESFDKPRLNIKKQRHYYANKGPHSQNYGFPVVMYGCESWTKKKAEC